MRFLPSSILFGLLVLMAGTCGCTRNHRQEEGAMNGLPPDFKSFYHQFHHDSTFQMEHIVFPLQGLPGHADPDSTGSVMLWQKETWKIHKPIDHIEDYIHTFDILGDDMIVETIEERNAPIAMQRRFARMAAGWHLIYYIEMQALSKKRDK
jgi:hypothetical protein